MKLASCTLFTQCRLRRVCALLKSQLSRMMDLLMLFPDRYEVFTSFALNNNIMQTVLKGFLLAAEKQGVEYLRLRAAPRRVTEIPS